MIRDAHWWTTFDERQHALTVLAGGDRREYVPPESVFVCLCCGALFSYKERGPDWTTTNQAFAGCGTGQDCLFKLGKTAAGDNWEDAYTDIGDWIAEAMQLLCRDDE